MTDQLIRDGVWSSQRLRSCSLEAHLAFAFLFPLADHWGRWEYDVEAIWVRTLAYRKDASAERLKGWLDELEAAGLFQRYSSGGKEYAAWMNFRGIPLDRRRCKSDIPEPPFDNSKSCIKLPTVDQPLLNRSPILIKGSVGGEGEREGTRDGDGGREGDWEREGKNDLVPLKRDAVEPPPVSATAEEARTVALAKLGPPPDREDLDLPTCAQLLFDYWRVKTGHLKAMWTPQRRTVLLARLKEEPGSAEEKLAGLQLAVDGAVASPRFNGTEDGKVYLDFENIFVHKGRNRIETLQGLAHMSVPKKRGLTADPDVQAFLRGAAK